MQLEEIRRDPVTHRFSARHGLACREGKRDSKERERDLHNMAK